MVKRGYVAIILFSIMAVGNLVLIATAVRNSGLSPDSRSDLIYVLMPITGVALGATFLFLFRTSQKRIEDLGEINYFAGSVILIVPAIAMVWIYSKISGLESDYQADNFMKILAIGELAFGGGFAVALDQLFGDFDK